MADQAQNGRDDPFTEILPDIAQPPRHLLDTLAVVRQTLGTRLIPIRVGPLSLIEEHGRIGQGHQDRAGIGQGHREPDGSKRAEDVVAVAGHYRS